jgi:hypothetical protein
MTRMVMFFRARWLERKAAAHRRIAKSAQTRAEEIYRTLQVSRCT